MKTSLAVIMVYAYQEGCSVMATTTAEIIVMRHENVVCTSLTLIVEIRTFVYGHLFCQSTVQW